MKFCRGLLKIQKKFGGVFNIFKILLFPFKLYAKKKTI